MVGLAGRDAEIAELEAALTGAAEHGAALLVVGEAGIGKTSLLDAAVGQARSRGYRVLTISGVESESQLPYAGLHQLLQPVLGTARRLPVAQRSALRTALGMRQGKPPELFLVALATLNLIDEVGEDRPLVLVADDVQWLDAPTTGVLSFIARRLESTHILVVIALREGFDIPLLSTHLPEIHVGPLSEAASRELLDSVASDLDHQTRRLILDESLGNPLALLELPQAVRRQGTDGREGPVGSLRLSERLERTFSAQAAGLPRRTQAALLFAALDQELSISDVLGATRTDIDEEATTDVLEPALEAGLVSIAGSIVRFRHPLIRSALEQSATEHLGMLDNAEYHAGSEGQAGVVCQPRHPPRLDGGGGAGTLVWSSERHGAQGINCSLRRSGKPPCRRRLAGPKLSHTAQAPSATEARGVARPC